MKNDIQQAEREIIRLLQKLKKEKPAFLHTKVLEEQWQKLEKQIPNNNAITQRKKLGLTLQDYVTVTAATFRFLLHKKQTPYWMKNPHKNIDAFFPQFFEKLQECYNLQKTRPVYTKVFKYIQAETQLSFTEVLQLFIEWKQNRSIELKVPVIPTKTNKHIRALHMFLKAAERFVDCE